MAVFVPFSCPLSVLAVPVDPHLVFLPQVTAPLRPTRHANRPFFVSF